MYKKMITSHICFFVTTLVLFFCTPLCAQENIDPDDDGHQWAWGENVGWLNFEPALGPGVTVGDTEVTGYVWANTIGWINLSPTGYDGVTNDGGTLSGWAWGENVGWISFACDDCGAANYGVSIDGDGQFDGYAWSKNIGWINFALLNRPDAAVKTSWPDGPSPCDPANAQCEDDSDCDPGEACHNCICSPVTFAEEIEFNVIPGSRAVTLAWTAVSEEDVLGYNILRRARRGGVRVQINDQLIPGTGSVETTVDYEFVDDAVQNRRTYQYTLVEVETDGGTREHGPVSATPRLLYGIGR